MKIKTTGMAIVLSIFFLLMGTDSISQTIASNEAGYIKPKTESKDNTSKKETTLAEELAIKHVQKSFVSQTGDIYWNKSVPVYISLLTSPEQKDGIVVKVDPSIAPAPYYFDTEGVNWIRTKWEVDPETKETILPKREVLWPVIADGLAPETSIKFESLGSFSSDGTDYFSGDVKITIKATDATSGVESIFYSLGSSFSPYNNPIAIESEDEWEIKFYAVDKVGNYSLPETGKKTAVNFVVDKSAPRSEIEVLGPKLGDIISPKSSLRLKSNDAKSGVKSVRYILSNNEEKTYVGDISLANLPDGAHNISYLAEDNVSNIESANEFNFYVDKIGPELSFDVVGDQFKSQANHLYVSERSQLRFTGTDNKAGLEQISVSLDESAYQTFTNPISTDIKAGQHALKYYGVDKVENKSKTYIASYIVDKVAPSIDYSITGPKHVRHDTLFVRDISKFNIKSVDTGLNQSGVKYTGYQIGTVSEIAYEKPFQIKAAGHNELKVKATDNVNNEATLSQIVFVDNEAPVISQTFSVDKIGEKTVRGDKYTIFPVELKVYLAANDSHVGSQNIYYQIGKGAEKLYSTPLTGFAAGTNVEVKVRAVDLLGNESKSKITFSVE